MLSGKLSSTLYMFVAAVMVSGFSLAQDKNDNQNSQNMHMNHMKMDHQMQQNPDSASFDLQAFDKNNDGKVYQCPMDFDVLSDNPGECSKCGMKLTEVSLEKASDNLVKKGYSVKVKDDTNSIVREGVIDLNAIDANKDGKVYQDMMDYNVISDNPGSCPLCGMTLNEVSLEKAKMYLEKTGHKVK